MKLDVTKDQSTILVKNMSKFETLREITNDWTVDYCPNHVYLISGIKVHGYQKNGKGNPIMFKQPLMFDKRFRKFERISESASSFKGLY
jgi:hypothetical protein